MLLDLLIDDGTELFELIDSPATPFDIATVGDGSADGSGADTISDVSIPDVIDDVPTLDSIADAGEAQDVAVDATVTEDTTGGSDAAPSPCPGAEGCASDRRRNGARPLKSSSVR